MKPFVLSKGALLLGVGIVSLLSAVPASAEEQTLSLSQVINYSLQNNGELRLFREEKGIRDAGLVRAGLLPNPILEFEASTGALTDSSDENSLTVGISQEFLLAGKRDKRLTIAEHELEIYRWQLADRERVIREEVKASFYETIHASKQAELADRAIDLNRQLLDVTKERLAAGDIPELEMNLVKVELARSEGARIDAAKALNQSQAKLWTYMGLPVGGSPALAGNLETEVAMTKSLVDLKLLASENRPDLKALESERNKGNADITMANAEGIPNLTAGLFYSRERGTDATGSGDEDVRDDLLGIRLSMPIPLFDRNQAGVQEARARKNSSETRLLVASREIEREVETAYASFLNSEKVLSLYKADIIPQLEENLKLTQEAYRLGEVGILAVIEEQRKYVEANDSYLSALYQKNRAMVKLEAAVGIELNEIDGGKK